MKTTVTQYDFREGFRGMREEPFSYYGLNALFEYLSEEESGGEEVEFNPNYLCWEYSEYTLGELPEFFPEVVERIDNPCGLDDWTEYFQDYVTEVIKVDETTIIIRDF